jgi:hypothetical protein
MENMQTAFPYHAYHLKWWAKLWYSLWALMTSGIAVVYWFFILASAASGDWSPFTQWQTILFCLGFPLLGYVFWAVAFRSRVILSGTHITVRGIFREKSADFGDIEGYRISITKNATFWKLQLRDGRGDISILRALNVDDNFRAFLSGLKNLDESTDFFGLNH